MRIASFATGTDRRLGVVLDHGVVDLATVGLEFTGIADLWNQWSVARPAIEAALADDPEVVGDPITWLPPLGPGSTFWAAAANYEAHLAEGGFPRPDYPPFFIRGQHSVVGHGGSVHKPWFSDRLDYEGELAVVIGRRARYVGEDEAMEHIAGYTCFNDGSVRDWQRHTPQITIGKNFAHSGALGPWVTTADQVPHIDDAELRTSINGRVVQRSAVGAAIWGVRYVISYLSAVTELAPGDVIALGTPAGVGARQDPPLFLTEGDVVEIEIDGVGALSHGVVEPKPTARPWPAGVS